MALSIRSPQVELLARKLANQSGQSITDVILSALKEKEGRMGQTATRQKIDALVNEASRLSVLDPRSPEQIIGYDEIGTPGGH